MGGGQNDAHPARRGKRAYVSATESSMDVLEVRLLAAHDTGDVATLVMLYLEAADRAAAGYHIEKECFFLTHAWIFALEIGDPLADMLRARLARNGRV